jgi:hypothetical protein
MNQTKLLFSLLVIAFASALAFPASAPAQTPPSATLTCTSSTTPGVTGYNLLRADCSTALDATGKCPSASEGAFAKILASPTCAFTDTTVLRGKIYSYAVTAFAPNTVESGQSPHNGASFVIIQPPGMPTITGLALNTVGKKTTVAATWTAPARDRTTWTLTNMSTLKVVASGAKNNKQGAYKLTTTIKGLAGAPLMFTVCDSSGCVWQTAS